MPLPYMMSQSKMSSTNISNISKRKVLLNGVFENVLYQNKDGLQEKERYVYKKHWKEFCSSVQRKNSSTSAENTSGPIQHTKSWNSKTSLICPFSLSHFSFPSLSKVITRILLRRITHLLYSFLMNAYPALLYLSINFQKFDDVCSLRPFPHPACSFCELFPFKNFFTTILIGFRWKRRYA